VVVSVVFVLNLIASYYDTTHALHASTILKMFAIWLFVSFPLTVVGTMFGRHWGGKNDFPCRVNNMARPIPAGPWYTHPLSVILATGVLPFGSIFIEMYFIFTSFWNYK
jgi:transmembrane 9 superfamily protein 3